MGRQSKDTLDANDWEREELLAQIGQVTAKIRQKLMALLAHEEVPPSFKTQFATLEEMLNDQYNIRR